MMQAYFRGPIYTSRCKQITRQDSENAVYGVSMC